MDNIFEYFSCEEKYSDMDAEGAVLRLSSALKFNTVSADPKEGAFDGLHALIKESYPHIMESASECRRFRNALLIGITGTDAGLKPALFMSHLDVVPVVKGTEADWKYDAFSGAVAEGYIWGRGAEDIKQQVFGCLEAAEYLLSKGCSFKRSVYFAFGDDEETFNQGALMISDYLKSKGVTLEFVLDEGGGKLYDAADFGAPGTVISDINLMEKGYADLELSVESSGGHSSNPFGGTSLEILSRAISAICENSLPLRMNDILFNAFLSLKDCITQEPLKTLIEEAQAERAAEAQKKAAAEALPEKAEEAKASEIAPDLPSEKKAPAASPKADALAAYCAGIRKLYPFVTTTIAPTMIEGGSQACNVMPQNMRAVINFRLDGKDSPEAVFEHCKKTVNDPRVKLRFLQANPASAAARSGSYGYRSLVKSLGSYYPKVRFIPMASAGATDAHNYEQICDVCLRCSPFMIPPEDLGGVHGTNERISIRSYIQGIRVLIDLMDKTLVQAD